MDMGGKFTLSDDSHGVAQVGLNFGGASDYLKSLGVMDLYYLERQGQDLETESKLPLLVKKVPFTGLENARFPSSVPPKDNCQT
jgi:histidinol-phosphatase (PHP family)